MTDDNSIPFLDLKAQYALIGEDILKALHRVVESQNFILGPEVDAFEREFAGYVGAGHAVGVASGTDALILTLKTLDLKPGDEVITTPYTFFSTVSSIVLAGGRPVFVDIDPDSFNIDPEKIRAAVTEKTRAILPVHLFGQCADMDPIMELAKEKGLFVLEDTAQASGARYSGKKAGSLGDSAAFSFYPSKTIGALGDAGMVVTDREDVWRKVQALRVHGAKYAQDYTTLGINSRLDAIQAAVLRVKLKHLDDWTRARRKVADYYEEAFRGSPVKTPGVKEKCEHAFNAYVIRVKDRDRLVDHLKDRNIGCAVYYAAPLHLMSCFSDFAPREGLPEAERASKESLAIPIFPEMTGSQAERVASVIITFLEG